VNLPVSVVDRFDGVVGNPATQPAGEFNVSPVSTCCGNETEASNDFIADGAATLEGLAFGWACLR
jgi:hypothetical protein